MFQFTREFIINDLNGKLKAKSNEHISSTLFGTNNKGRFAITEYKKEETNDEVIITYTTKIWNRTYNKTLRLCK